MAGPQLENGYTRIANELLDAIIATDFTKREICIVMAVIRKTYGYGKKSDDITISQLSYMTGIGRPNASRTYHGLVSRNVLKSSPGVFGYETSLNKRHWEWDDRAKTIPRREIMERDGWKCRQCGRDTPVEMSGLYVDSAPEVDHIVEVSAGGKDDESNLQLLCRKCHQGKTKSYLKGHAGVPKGTRGRASRDTVDSSGVCRKGHADRAEGDTQGVSVGTRGACRKGHTQKTTPKDNPKRQPQKTVARGADATAQTAKTAATWKAYAEAYRARYGVAPLRNAKVNGQLAQFVNRVGVEVAPLVAAYFVTHNGQFYVQRGHQVGMLLNDAEKLHTEYLTKRQVTARSAREVDQRQDQADMYQRLIEKARAQR